MFTIILLLISLNLSKIWKSYNVELETKKLESANEVGARRNLALRLRLDLPVRMVAVSSRSDKRVARVAVTKF